MSNADGGTVVPKNDPKNTLRACSIESWLGWSPPPLRNPKLSHEYHLSSLDLHTSHLAHTDVQGHVSIPHWEAFGLYSPATNSETVELRLFDFIYLFIDFLVASTSLGIHSSTQSFHLPYEAESLAFQEKCIS